MSVAQAKAKPAPARPGRLYGAVRQVARFWLWFLFKRVDVRHPERVPPTGPVLLCINHPNNLIDSLLVGAVLERKVHYLATAALFRNPLLARFLRACGAIPVYRKQDGVSTGAARATGNADAFAACHAAFDDGALVAIYPEGTTHAEARVQRIKTGAARIALGYEADHPGALTVLPVGLSFEARKSFRGRVLVAFGEPVGVAPYLTPWRSDAVAAVDALTTTIQSAMEGQVVHVDRIDNETLVRAVEELYRDELVRQIREERGLAERQIDVFRLSRTIAAAADHFRKHEPERLESLWQRIRGYRAMLAAYRVKDEAVRARLARGPARRRVVWTGEAIAGLPLFAYGAVVNALPYFIPRWIARATARKETDYATTRLLATVVAVPLFWGLETWLVARAADPAWALVFLLSLPVSGLIAYHYLRGIGALRRDVRFGMLALTRDTAARELVAERAAIIADLDRAKTDYLAATRGSSF
ncbi:MAG TPA: 1-acyl-sn-glycerol-3-phosphate acyltransferase [Methylomirabilota bacterium]|nr:1-acyl-sn-glycerol-3-phosphate acyltransferase [Methylomirabilota bacterium]